MKTGKTTYRTLDYVTRDEAIEENTEFGVGKDRIESWPTKVLVR